MKNMRFEAEMHNAYTSTHMFFSVKFQFANFQVRLSSYLHL